MNGRKYSEGMSNTRIETPEQHEIYLIANQVFEASNEVSEMYWNLQSGQTTQAEIDKYLQDKKQNLPNAYNLLEPSLQEIITNTQSQFVQMKADEIAN